MALLLNKVTILSLVILSSACTVTQQSKRESLDTGIYTQLSQSDDGKLKVPAGMNLPKTSPEYAIPAGELNGETGKNVDIRAPEQVVPLIRGLRVQAAGNQGIIILENRDQAQDMWPRLRKILNDEGYLIASEQENLLITDWITWPRLDEDTPFQARYEISLKPSNYQSTIMVRLGDIKHGSEEIVPTPAQIGHYTVTMLNSLIQGLEREAMGRRSTETNVEYQSLSVQTAKDETGLPTLVVRAPFKAVWERLPKALAQIGMTIKSSDVSRGSLVLKYQSLNQGQLDKLGLDEISLKNGEYHLQAGDLDNRTSLQFRSTKDQPLVNDLNEALRAHMQSAFEQN